MLPFTGGLHHAGGQEADLGGGHLGSAFLQFALHLEVFRLHLGRDGCARVRQRRAEVLGGNLSRIGAGAADRGQAGPAEIVYATEAKSPNRIMLNVDRVMRTDYVISDLQPTYFVIESFEDLYRQTVERDFDRLYRSLHPGFTYANSAVIDLDNVLHVGTQEYLLRGGRGSGARPN